MIINGIEIKDIDVTDADVMERYEKAHDKVAETMQHQKLFRQYAYDLEQIRANRI